jgi:hypothetical protein
MRLVRTQEIQAITPWTNSISKQDADFLYPKKHIRFLIDPFEPSSLEGFSIIIITQFHAIFKALNSRQSETS